MGNSSAKKGKKEAQAKGSDDMFLTDTKADRQAQRLSYDWAKNYDELWKQTRLPSKYREHVTNEQLGEMAHQADEQNVPLRSVVVEAVKNGQEQKELENAEWHHHTFHTATHRTGFSFNPWKHLGHFFVFALFPWLLFLGIGIMFIYMYYLLPWITLFIVFVIGALSCLFFLSGAMSNSLFRTFMGILCLIATISGCVAGMKNFNENLFHYWSATEGRQYTNVRSDSLAAAHADAGVLVFTDEAVVDTTKTVGYKSGSVYCIAPISRKEQTHASEVQYWAAGTDCCNGRGFFSCDDAADKDAKSGLVIREQPASLLFKSEVDYYMHAIEMSSEIYGLTAAKEPFFVRWTKDVTVKAESYMIAGWTDWGTVGIIYLVVNFIAACLLQGIVLQAKNKALEKPVDNFATSKGEQEPLVKTQGPGNFTSQRWGGLDNPNSEIRKPVDPLHHFEHDNRGIDTTTMPRGTESPQFGQQARFSGDLERTHDSIATTYGDNNNQFHNTSQYRDR